MEFSSRVQSQKARTTMGHQSNIDAFPEWSITSNLICCLILLKRRTTHCPAEGQKWLRRGTVNVDPKLMNIEHSPVTLSSWGPVFIERLTMLFIRTGATSIAKLFESSFSIVFDSEDMSGRTDKYLKVIVDNFSRSSTRSTWYAKY